MVGYNLTSIVGNSTGFLEFTRGVNDVLMFGWLGAVLLMGIGMVLLMSILFVTGEFKKAIMATSSICFALSVGLRGLELLPNLGIYITLIIWAASVAFSFKSN